MGHCILRTQTFSLKFGRSDIPETSFKTHRTVLGAIYEKNILSSTKNYARNLKIDKYTGTSLIYFNSVPKIQTRTDTEMI